MCFIKIVKRIVEGITKLLFLRLVLNAYKKTDCFSHRLIRSLAARNYGVIKSRCRIFFKWCMDFIIQAQIDLFHKKNKIQFNGITSIAFRFMKIEWSSNDANSSIVYLSGFSDNKTCFDIYKKYTVPGSTVLDIGANIGIHTLVFSACLGNEGAVLAFEPSAAIFKRLNNNITLNNCTNVVPLQMAIGDRYGTVKFNTNEGDFNIGKGSVSSEGQDEVTIARIDDVLIKYSGITISVIKIDTEGHELSVLRGAHDTLKKYKPVIIAEVNNHSNELQDFFSLIPFKADFYQIPQSYYSGLLSLEKTRITCQDILVLPKPE